MKPLISLITFIFSLTLFAQDNENIPAYLNHTLKIEERVEDLVSRMTLEEKVSQTVNAAKAIPRLNIPEYDWWNECLHGVARAGMATVFPQAIGLAATWNTELMAKISDVISTEARAKHHEFLRNGERDRYKGLTFWSPNINIFRDPRWGRGQETYGEDPYLTSRMGVEFVKGLQGSDSKYLKLVATPKHYAVHSGPEPERHTFDAITDNFDLYDTYLPAFEATVKEANAYSVMCAYNRYLGEACCGSPSLLKKILRDDWGFEGYVVSDCGAIRDIHENHKIVETPPEAAALAVKSGTDLNCGDVYDDALVKAVEEGLITEEEIDITVKRLFTARFKLGMFDPPEIVKYAQIPYEKNDSEEHRKLSIRAAQESIVLLKNENNTLPLKKDLTKIAVIGPTADSYEMLIGNYNGTPSKYVTPLKGIKKKIEKDSPETVVAFEPGCDLVEEGTIVYDLSTEMLTTNGQKGIKAEFFKSRDFDEEPFYTTTIKDIRTTNWLWSVEIPGLGWRDSFSARYTGKFHPKKTGKYSFIIKGDDGYRLYINDELIVEDWSDHEVTTTSGNIELNKDESYNIKIEYFQSSGWPLLQVKWELLNVDYFANAVKLAKNSDAIIFIGGITAELEGEEMRVDYEGFKGGDRISLDLPKVQRDLLKVLHSTGKPIVLVLTSGSALSVNWANQNIPAVIQLWYPGQEGGTALADVIFGDYNPAGRLPVTFYKSVDQLPPFEDYSMAGRTYRYFEGEPLYTFGYGLSYSKFEYENLSVPKEVTSGEDVVVSVDVKNTSGIAGDEVVQLYLKDLESGARTPIHSLQGFERVHLKPGEAKTVKFTLTPRQLSVIEAAGENNIRYVVEPGMFKVSLGGVQPGVEASSTGFITEEFNVTGEKFVVPLN